ncbi:hypothetical protein CASFOL_009288 [Castilleja foliolosa]|uniref:Uncharacterized protein n=1 Tax=Castilleja foliolosa TaxID=1961234 RepID=A0ABD3E0U4_9LAMI
MTNVYVAQLLRRQAQLKPITAPRLRGSGVSPDLNKRRNNRTNYHPKLRRSEPIVDLDDDFEADFQDFKDLAIPSKMRLSISLIFDSRPDELIAKFVDEKLRAGNKGASGIGAQSLATVFATLRPHNCSNAAKKSQLVLSVANLHDDRSLLVADLHADRRIWLRPHNCSNAAKKSQLVLSVADLHAERSLLLADLHADRRIWLAE